MAKKKQKFYVVWKGVQTGVYQSWVECQAQIKNFAGAQFMAFPNEAQAQLAYRSNPWNYLGKQGKTPGEKKTALPAECEANLDSWSVDAACSGNPGVMEYQCVDTGSGIQIFHAGPYPDATNNVGEFLALVHALALLKQHGKNTPVYSDSMTAIAWVRNKKAKTLLAKTPRNKKVFDLISRAEAWLKANKWDTEILKWDTANWGEIPADFGRK